MTPRRIQRKREKGWRSPPGAVYVGRRTKWGNPYRVFGTVTAQMAVDAYALAVRAGYDNVPGPEEIRAELAGKDLTCWCPLTDKDGHPVPCHADVLLQIAAGDPPASTPRTMELIDHVQDREPR